MTTTLWWQRGIIYQVYPRSFQDSGGDGIGDLPGITRRLGHLAWLGVDAVWLSPIYPSPMADFGYDVSDYCAVAPIFGTIEDFDRLAAEVHAHGLRLILDFVPNHTSDQHSVVPGKPQLARQPAAGLVYLAGPGAGRRAAEQLAQPLRRRRVGVGRRHGAVLPALLPEGAARPELAQPGRAAGDVRRAALLA